MFLQQSYECQTINQLREWGEQNGMLTSPLFKQRKRDFQIIKKEMDNEFSLEKTELGESNN